MIYRKADFFYSNCVIEAIKALEAFGNLKHYVREKKSKKLEDE